MCDGASPQNAKLTVPAWVGERERFGNAFSYLPHLLNGMMMAKDTDTNAFDDEMDMKVEDDIVVVVAQRSETAASQRRPSATLKSRKPANLACLNCRPRKIKCIRVDGACERCRLLKLPCKIPDRDERKVRYSKDYIESLENEILELRQALEQARSTKSETNASDTGHSDSQERSSASPKEIKTPPSDGNSPPNNLIEHLCGPHRRRDGNGNGQSRFFGPTSSLHFTETPNMASVDNHIARREMNVYDSLPQEIQEICLNLYWTYQHQVLTCIHKEAFLAGMKVGRGPYFSRCLLFCILASGARLSERPDIRSLAIPTTEHERLQKRPLIRLAEEAFEAEVKAPSITTIQSMLLLSVLYCIQSIDTRGWMLSGDACRLVFDLGLHQDPSCISEMTLSPIDVEARQTVFWGCFNLDRLWSLYLGRPAFIKLSDVSIRRPSHDSRTWDLRLVAAWAGLLEIAGQIADRLNTNSCTQARIDQYTDELQQWHRNLENPLQFDIQRNSGVFHLQLQYSAMMILVNRHNAWFGNPDKRRSNGAIKSRETCMQHAFRISHMMRDYRDFYGDGSTLVGSALYNVTMAATTFVAEIFEAKKETFREEIDGLTICLQTLKEMEHTEIVAKNVFNIVQATCRACHVSDETLDLESLSPRIGTSPAPRFDSMAIPYDAPAFSSNQTTLAMWPAFDFEGVDLGQQIAFAFEQPIYNGDLGVGQYL